MDRFSTVVITPKIKILTQLSLRSLTLLKIYIFQGPDQKSTQQWLLFFYPQKAKKLLKPTRIQTTNSKGAIHNWCPANLNIFYLPPPKGDLINGRHQFLGFTSNLTLKNIK